MSWTIGIIGSVIWSSLTAILLTISWIKLLSRGLHPFLTIFIAITLFADQTAFFTLVSLDVWEKAVICFIIKCVLWPILFAGEQICLRYIRIISMSFSYNTECGYR